MYLQESSSDDYVLVAADWNTALAQGLIFETDATHVVIHRTDPEDYYYLYTRPEALNILESRPDAPTVHQAFNLHEYEATPALDVFESADEAPDRTIILREGLVIGFMDVTVAPTRASSIYRSARRGSGESESAPRSLKAEFPEKLNLGSTASLLVSLSQQVETGAGLPVDLPIGTPIDIVVHPQRGLVIEGESEGQITVSDEAETLPLQFKLRAVETGLCKFRVLAFHKGSPLGAIMLAPMVLSADEAVSSELSSHQRSLSEIRVSQPDLQLLILENQSNGKHSFDIRITAADPSLGLYLKPYGPIELKGDPQSLFNDFFDSIDDLAVKTDEDRKVAEVQLSSKGMWLFDKIMPNDLKVVLWELKDRIKSVQVESEEPWIPWELCKMEGKENGEVVEGEFFCESFAVTRWIPGVGKKPKLGLKKIGLVVPGDSGLPFAQEERDYMLSLASDKRQIEDIEADFLKVHDALAGGTYDGWHFTGHGAFRDSNPNRSGMVLEKGFKMTPEHLSGKAKNLGKAQPLVFLNACQIGKSAVGLTDIGGWANEFLEAGASAFVGAYWSIYDHAAIEFAKSFYDSLLNGEPIGNAAKVARASIRPLGDPTWLAYTVYADPLAKVE